MQQQAGHVASLQPCFAGPGESGIIDDRPSTAQFFQTQEPIPVKQEEEQIAVTNAPTTTSEAEQIDEASGANVMMIAPNTAVN